MILIADRQAIAASGIPMLVRDFETARELTYQWKLAENWFVQPDLQYIVHPGGNVTNPANSTSAIPNALVIGTRATLRF
jgi:porin